MLVVGEYVCYHCGTVVARAVSDPRGTEGRVRLERASNAPAPSRPRGALRCHRCGGPVYLDRTPLSLAEELPEKLSARGA